MGLYLLIHFLLFCTKNVKHEIVGVTPVIPASVMYNENCIKYTAKHFKVNLHIPGIYTQFFNQQCLPFRAETCSKASLLAEVNSKVLKLYSQVGFCSWY